MPPSAITGTSDFFAASTRIHDRGELRHADAGDDARGADRARADADLDRSAPASISACAPSAVATLPAMTCTAVGQPLDALRPRRARARNGRARCRSRPRRRRHRSARSVRSKPSSPTVVAAATRRRPCASLVALRMGAAFSMSLTVIRPTQRYCVVDHQQLLDAVLVQQPLGLVLADALAHRDEVLLRHQLGDLLAGGRWRSARRGW